MQCWERQSLLSCMPGAPLQASWSGISKQFSLSLAVPSRYLAQALHSLRHGDGRPVCELYGAHGNWAVQSSAEIEKHQAGRPVEAHKQVGSRLCLPGAAGQGPVVAFNLLRSCGAYVGYR